MTTSSLYGREVGFDDTLLAAERPLDAFSARIVASNLDHYADVRSRVLVAHCRGPWSSKHGAVWTVLPWTGGGWRRVVRLYDGDVLLRHDGAPYKLRVRLGAAVTSVPSAGQEPHLAILAAAPSLLDAFIPSGTPSAGVSGYALFSGPISSTSVGWVAQGVIQLQREDTDIVRRQVLDSPGSVAFDEMDAAALGIELWAYHPSGSGPSIIIEGIYVAEFGG